ncbi:LamG-like jellyroll fold domain-containing protein, partial [Salmonella sp. SAL4446]|uniref:LamG-like jellyroll fold domain-containing protein n=1 Tax=Salmonella sp. SAL4446 TaxID=3159901 RepID=UPI00397D0359
AEARFSALLAIGRQGNAVTAGDYWRGLIDELSLYNRALTAAEIQSIYQAGSDGKVLPYMVVNHSTPGRGDIVAAAPT